MNKLFYGDNLGILREYIKDETVDLIYLDPPFNSNRNYNVLFKSESGSEAESQITAFEDTWHWNASAEETYRELILAGDNVGQMVESFRGFIGENQMMAYLVMMAIRLKELHRVLKPTGSLYLHCDPTASHYLKILLDTIFGVNFRSEIIWKRTSSHNSAKRWGPIHDVILFYSKTDTFCWNRVSQPYDERYVETFYRYQDGEGRFRVGDLTGAGIRNGDSGKEWRGVNPTNVGRHWAVPAIPGLDKVEIDLLTVHQRLDKLDEMGLIYWPPKGKVPQFKRYLDPELGVAIQDIIIDIDPISPQAKELLGYPTQKPVALLERILKASSNEGDLVLDPFCGCGTTIAAAQNLNRRWIGIDITHLAVGLQKFRLKDTYRLTAGKDYQVIGQPEDLEGARNLAKQDRYGFQWWILPLIGARALGAEAGKRVGKKGSDKGIDGTMTFMDGDSGKTKKVVISVKSGKVNVSHIRDLVGTVEREKAAIGVYVTLEPPTKPMITEAVSAGFYHSERWLKDYPRIQILTVEEILAGKRVNMPAESFTFKKAEKEGFSHKQQLTIFDEE